MKIEKLSENQIRCTLNKSDLASRQLKISELAYGSEKAKELFRDMMQQASYELGFEADDIPLMIEAIPISADCIVLIVTKVDDPEELDTRFSKFSPINSDDDERGDYEYPFDDDYETLESIDSSYPTKQAPLTVKDELNESANKPDDDVLSLFSRVKDYLNKNIESASDNDSMDKVKKDNSEYNKDGQFVPLKETENATSDTGKAAITSVSLASEENSKKRIVRVFCFDSLDIFNEAAIAVSPVFHGYNTLYKDSIHEKYYLTIEKGKCSAINFNKTCNILSEYGKKETLNIDRINYFKEHFDIMIRDRAIQVMSKL